jgi:hypothetical protein
VSARVAQPSFSGGCNQRPLVADFDSGEPSTRLNVAIK